MFKFLLIFLGSGAGGTLRYWLSSVTHRMSGTAFPIGTLVVNLSGCLLIGFLSAAFATRFAVHEEYRLAMTVGVLGGFTTFSAFGVETFGLLSDGRHTHALFNVCLSVGLGIAAIWCGYRLGEGWFGS